MTLLRRYPAFTAGIVAFLGALAVLVPSLAPSVPGGHDSGELLSDAIVMGIPHPPGYPLYAMLGHVWSWLPVGNLAYRLNLFSGFSLALAGGFLAVAFTRVTTRPIAGVTAAWLFCFAYSPWRQGVGAEVFALHLCILSAFLMEAICWSQAETLQGRRLWMFLGCATFGLGAAHHHIIVLCTPGILGYMIWSRGKGRPWGLTWYAVVTLLVLGFLPYAYLYIRSNQHCLMNWGDPSNWERLKAHVLRKAYGSLALNSASGTVPRSDDAQALGYFASLTRNQFPFPLLFFAAGGLAVAFRRPRLLLLFGWIFFIYGPGFALYSAQPPNEFFLDMVERFYSSSYVGVAAFIALGLGWVADRLSEGRWARVVWLIPLLAVYTVLLNWPACSLRGQYHPDDHVLAVMDYLPENAVVLLDGDLPAGEWAYYHFVLKRRPDLLGIFPGLLPADWYRRDFMPPDLGAAVQQRFEHSDPKTREYLQTFVDECRARGLDVYCSTNFAEAKTGEFYPEGLLFRYRAENEPRPTRKEQLERAQKALAFLKSRPIRGSYRFNARDQTFWTRYLIGQWVRGYNGLAEVLYPDDSAGAETALKAALDMDPSITRSWVFLARIYEDQNRLEEAQAALDRALKTAPADKLALEAKLRLSQQHGTPDEVARWNQALEDRKRYLDP